MCRGEGDDMASISISLKNFVIQQNQNVEIFMLKFERLYVSKCYLLKSRLKVTKYLLVRTQVTKI